MILGFGNNTSSSLAADITAAQTAISVLPGAGTLFSELLTSDIASENAGHGIYAKVTITDAEETVFEICHLTAVSGDVLTVIRGQERTTAIGWPFNSRIVNMATRGSENTFVQVEHLQGGDFTSALAQGSENALTISLPTTYFDNGATDWDLRVPLLVTPALTNTGPATLALTLGGVVTGIFPIYKGNQSPVDAGDLLAGVPICCLLDQSKSFFNVINPVAAYSGVIKTVNGHGPDAVGAVNVTSQDIFNGQATGLTEDTDLNTITTPGVYYNPANANATPENNYPGTSAGSLLVLKDAGFTQIYTEYSGGYQYRRGYYGSEWGEWVQLYDSGHLPQYPVTSVNAKTGVVVLTAADVHALPDTTVIPDPPDLSAYMKTADANAKFVQGVQLGAEVTFSRSGEDFTFRAATGSVLTGVNIGSKSGEEDEFRNIYSKPIQENVNGTYKTIAG